MRPLSLAPVLAALALVAMSPSPAFTQTASGPGLSPEERDVLRAIVACKTDASPAYCPMFQTMFAKIEASKAPAPRAQTAVAVRETMATYRAGIAQIPETPVAASDFASGHGSGPVGQSIPPKGGHATVDLAATSDTKTASIALNIDLSPTTSDAVKSLSITAQTPFGQGQDYQNLATLDGLTKATSIGLQYTLLTIRSTSNATMITTPRYQDTCQALVRELVAADPTVKINPDWLEPNGCNARGVLTLVQANGNLGDQKTALIEALDTLRQTGIPTIDSLWLLSANGKVGYEQHSFFDGATLAKDTRDRTPFQLGVAGTYVFKGGVNSLTLSYNYQRAYKDGAPGGQTQTLCPPTGSPVLKCVSGYINAPVETEKDLIGLDYRYISPPGAFPIPIGVNPAFTYDARSGVYGVQVPIYIVVNKAKSLTGGVRYDWTSDKHQSIVGVFVASAFCVLPGFSGCAAPSGSDK
jgi:hypothetical protein